MVLTELETRWLLGWESCSWHGKGDVICAFAVEWRRGQILETV
jgi:hypothetical protein